MISLERERLEWNKKMDLLRNELEQAQREKNEARQSEIETRIRQTQQKTHREIPAEQNVQRNKSLRHGNVRCENGTSREQTFIILRDYKNFFLPRVDLVTNVPSSERGSDNEKVLCDER